MGSGGGHVKDRRCKVSVTFAAAADSSLITARISASCVVATSPTVHWCFTPTAMNAQIQTCFSSYSKE